MDSQPLAVVVLAAGLGKRMASRQPKVLHRLAGLPIAAHVLRALAPLNPTRTVMVVGHGADQVRATLGDSYGPDGALPIEYALQSEQLGTGHAVLMSEALLQGHKGSILVVYGDSPLLRTGTLSALVNRHRQTNAYITMLTCIAADPTGYGRVARDANQSVVEVVEERAATLVQRAISEINSGVYVFDSAWLWPHLARIELNRQGEYYLTDLIGRAVKEGRNGNSAPFSTVRRGSRESGPPKQGSVVTFTLEGLDEALGINSKAQLAQAEEIVQARLRRNCLDAGVTLLLPDTVYLNMDVAVGADTVLYPGVVLEGSTQIGPRCVIGPNSHIVDSVIGEDCRIVASTIEGSRLERGVTVGPYSHLRAGTHLGEDAHVGNFAEVKESTLEHGVRMGHFGYIGDAHVGEDANIGAGVVTANYDGKHKHRTTIGKGAFIGVGTMLRAPIEIGDEAATGAGSVVLQDVPPGEVVAGVPARPIKRKASTEQ